MVDDELPRIEIVESEAADDEMPARIPTPESLGIDLPEDPDAGIVTLLSALAESRREADSYLDDLRRVAADFDNFRKRSHRELAGVIDRAAERVVSSLLPVLDSLDAALSIEPHTETEEKLIAGVRSTQAQLLDVLAKEGLEPIVTWDQPFDPEVHEAVMTTGESSGPIVVSHELRRGYRLKGRVLRAALVGVSVTERNDQPDE